MQASTFRQWGPVLANQTQIQRGERVIYVTCGTGVLALAELERVGPQGEVIGLDANPDMLGVARCKSDRTDWREGRAEELPFPNGSLDAAISQFGLMLFEDLCRRPAGNDARARTRWSAGRCGL
ncbi:methyltransferase domain-containing protein [Mesorhizobium sp.]|uniref:methyltransferase domain-containing protein n=1 Tax=Mesorhizobium sp. TaxID=1871066 RepID=UPI0025C52D4F|nr:methyltransferase domain-containing protein [Mesorhizobium sp.]